MHWLMGRALILAALGLLIVSAHAPNRQRVTEEAPPVKGQAAYRSARNPSPANQIETATPIRIVEDANQARHTEVREGYADEHDAEDLDAQVRAADAVEKQVVPIWAGAALSFGGTLLILWSLSIARKANRLVESTAKHQLRAYVGIESHDLEPYEWGSAETGKAKLRIKNYGQTPAIQCVTKIKLAVAPYNRDSPRIPRKWTRQITRPSRDIPPQGDMLREVNLPVEAIISRWEELTGGQDAIFVRIDITYSSFGRRYRQTTVMHASGKRYRDGKLNTTKQYAEEQLSSDES